MHKIDGAGHIGNQWVAEDLATNRPPTEITHDFMNAVQGELCTLVEAGGAALSKADNAQIVKVLLPETATYALLRAYAGPATALRVAGRTNVFDGAFGVFRLDAADVASADNDGTILVGAAGRRWKRIFAGEINLRWFGLVGDGATNNATKINNAMAVAHAAGGGVIVNDLPGVYALTSELSLGNATTLRSVTGVRYLRKHLNGMLSNNRGVTVATGGYTGNGGIEIDGGIWDYNGANYYQSSNIFSIGYADGFTLKNTVCLDVVRAHVVDLSASCNVLIERNQMLGFAHLQSTSDDTLGEDRTYAEAVQLDHNRPGSFFFGALDGTQSKNITFRHNVVGRSTNADVRFGGWGAGIGAHGSIYDRYHTDIFIYKNIFSDCIYAGVRPFKWRDTEILGNIFKGGVRGVHVSTSTPGTNSSLDIAGVQTNLPQAGDRVRITGNSFDGQSAQSIYFPAPGFIDANYCKTTDVTITGNMIRNSGAATSSSAIDLRWTHKATVTGNTLEYVFRAFYGRFNTSLLVQGNILDTATREFVWIDESGEVTFAGAGHSANIVIGSNNARSMGYTGILIQGAIRSLDIVGNHLKGVSTFEATRTGINIGSGALGGYIAGNVVIDGGAANKPIYGLQITSTCSGFAVGSNVLFGTTAPMLDQSTAPERTVGGLHRIEGGGMSVSGPGLLFSGFGETEGDIGIADGDALDICHYNTTTGVVTPRWRIDSTGDLTPAVDNVQKIGSVSKHINLLYVGTGSVTASDERMKQQIQAVHEAVLRAWERVEFCQYKYNSAVSEKGDGARWHLGLVAQKVKAAFEAEGIDPFSFGILCYDEWEEIVEKWEDQFEIIDAGIDADGNEFTVERRLVKPAGSRVVQEAGNRYAVRYEEALVLEAALARWKAKQQAARTTELEAVVQQLLDTVAAQSKRLAALEGQGGAA